MPTLQSIAELSWRKLFPSPSDETAITKEEFVESAKIEFAYQLLLQYWGQKRQDGSYDIPSYLLRQEDLPVEDDQIDISSLEISRSLPNDIWLSCVGDITCGCEYVKSTVNMTQLMCDDDSLGDKKTYLIVGNRIRFPRGTYSNKIPITYASKGLDLDGELEIDEALGALVRQRLQELYGNPEVVDVTNNTNPNV